MRFLLALLVFALAPFTAQATTYESYLTAVLQGTDKVTGHVERITVPVGADMRFGGLYVRVRACNKTPPEELPESVAFLEISEVTKDVLAAQNNSVPPKIWFSGWMFASNPSLAALEHPVYDIAIVNCLQPVNTEADQPAAAPVAAPATNASTKAALPATVPSR